MEEFYAAYYSDDFKYIQLIYALIKLHVLSVHSFVKCSLVLNEIVLKIMKILDINKQVNKKVKKEFRGPVSGSHFHTHYYILS